MATIQDRRNPSRKMSVNPDGSINTSGADRVTLIDDASAISTTYFGYADAGVGTTADAWQIKIIDESGGYFVTKWANGNTRFEHIWSNRASLNYL